MPSALWIRRVRMADGSVEEGVEIGECAVAWISTLSELRDTYAALVPLLELYNDPDCPFFTNWIHRWDSVEEASECLIERIKLDRWDSDSWWRFVDVDRAVVVDGRANVVRALRRMLPLKPAEVYAWFGDGCERGTSPLYVDFFADADRLVGQLARDAGCPQSDPCPAGWLWDRMLPVDASVLAEGASSGRCWLCGTHKVFSHVFAAGSGRLGVGSLCATRVRGALRRVKFLESAQSSLNELSEKIQSELLEGGNHSEMQG